MGNASTTPHQGAFTYLDTASAEPLHPAARDVLLAALDQGYADPRRLHNPGRTARLLLDNAREAIAEALELRPDEVTFTASGTDAVHRGLLGLRAGRARHGDTIVHSQIEHSAVLHAVAWSGSPAIEIGVDETGRVAPSAVAHALNDTRASLVAVQAANHEVGTTQPIADIAESAGDVPVFMDACAAVGRVPLPEGWAVGTASAHKWGGPPGVGLLLVRKGARWRNPFPGDERVDARAAGFENVPGALAAAAALQAVVSERTETAGRQNALIERIRQAVIATVPDVEVVGHPSERLPHLVTFSCLYVDGEALVTELDRAGFAIASGSACTASSLEPSHVLAAMGALTHGNVRLSLGRSTSEAEVDRFLLALPALVAELRSRVGL